MTLEEALSEVERLNGEVKKAGDKVSALEAEKQKLIDKNSEILGKLTKYKKFEGIPDEANIEELLKLRERVDAGELIESASVKQQVNADEAKRQKEIEKLTKKIDELTGQYEQEKKTSLERRIEAEVIAACTKAEVINPSQMYVLNKSNYALDETGKVAYKDSLGRFIEIGQHLESLKQDTDYLHHFKGLGATGTGSLPTGTGKPHSTPEINPWLTETRNITLAGQIAKSDPEKAKRLKAEADAKNKKAS